MLQNKYGPVGLIHIDAHCDVNEHMNTCAFAHGTTFRRAFEDGCLDSRRVVQIGMRGSGHSLEDYAWPMSQVAATHNQLSVIHDSQTYNAAYSGD